MQAYNLAVCLFMTVTVPSIYSFCFSGQAVARFENGVPDVTCNTMHGEMRPEESITKDCVQCNCSAPFFSCCGIGYKSGVVSYPGCEMKILDNCCFQMINSTHPTETCSGVIC